MPLAGQRPPCSLLLLLPHKLKRVKELLNIIGGKPNLRNVDGDLIHVVRGGKDANFDNRTLGWKQVHFSAWVAVDRDVTFARQSSLRCSQCILSANFQDSLRSTEPHAQLFGEWHADNHVQFLAALRLDAEFVNFELPNAFPLGVPVQPWIAGHPRTETELRPCNILPLC